MCSQSLQCPGSTLQHLRCVDIQSKYMVALDSKSLENHLNSILFGAQSNREKSYFKVISNHFYIDTPNHTNIYRQTIRHLYCAPRVTTVTLVAFRSLFYRIDFHRIWKTFWRFSSDTHTTQIQRNNSICILHILKLHCIFKFLYIAKNVPT